MDKLDNKTYTITGKTIKCRNIVKTIKSFYRSNSRVKFCNPETSQPQKHCIGKNEIQVAVNLTEGLLRYDSDIQRGRK